MREYLSRACANNARACAFSYGTARARPPHTAAQIYYQQLFQLFKIVTRQEKPAQVISHSGHMFVRLFYLFIYI